MDAEAANTPCRVCGSTAVAEWLHPREMMFGMRDRFDYFRCAECGCLQINELPPDLGRFYPANYYSYSGVSDSPGTLKGRIKRKYISPRLTRHLLGWGGASDRILAAVFRPPTIPSWLRCLVRPVGFDRPILDVGCGSGMSLLALRNCGFSSLRGVDPYISGPLAYSGGIQVDKCSLSEVSGQFDLIMFHHVFEHVENPLATLTDARRLLAREGQILIRIPLSDSVAAQRYREKWVQLDAPRHITLQTRKSMDLLAGKARLRITRVVYDSTDIQFWGSEQYIRDIPLFDACSYYHAKPGDVFSPGQIQAFAAESEELNRQGKGDQAAFVLEAC